MEDIIRLRNDIENDSSDILAQGSDLRNIQNWRRGHASPQLSHNIDSNPF